MCPTEQARPQPVEPDTREAAYRYHASLAVSSSKGLKCVEFPISSSEHACKEVIRKIAEAITQIVRLPLTGYTLNLAFRVLTPVVILELASATFYSVNLGWLVSDIRLVSVYYFGVRVVYNGVTKWCLLLNWRTIPAPDLA